MTATVHKLPTAAATKVRNRITRRNMAAFEQCAEFPVQRVFEASPYMQKVREEARTMLHADAGTTALRLVVAMYGRMSDIDKALIVGRLAMEAGKSESAKTALAFLRHEDAPKHQRRDVALQMDAMLRGEVE